MMGIAKKEAGICVCCGKETPGAKAKPDLPIKTVRFFRSLLQMPARHSVCCKKCAGNCVRMRHEYDRKKDLYLAFSAIFALAVMAGALFAGGDVLHSFIGAALGAAFIYCLSYLSYFPSFGR